MRLYTKISTFLGLSPRPKAPAWELVLLLLLLVTIFGIAIRGPLHSFPDLSQNAAGERDPYGIGLERPASDRPTLVETGL